MIQKLKNSLVLNVADQTFTTYTSIKCYIQQNDTVLTYTPTVVSNTQVAVTVPYADAMKLLPGACEVQLFWTDGVNKRATKIVSIDVEEVIPEGGYNE